MSDRGKEYPEYLMTRPVVSSRKVAEVFEKEHKHVMRDIKALGCDTEFNQSNFGLVEYRDAKGEMRPEYLMTRLGFSVLTMGFNGAKAMQWKIKYIARHGLSAAWRGYTST